MQMPLRDGDIFSFSNQGHAATIDLERGSYGLDAAERAAGTEFEDIVRLDGIGEFAVPPEAVQAVEDMYGSADFSAEQRLKALLGKMLEIGCRKVWTPPGQ